MAAAMRPLLLLAWFYLTVECLTACRVRKRSFDVGTRSHDRVSHVMIRNNKGSFDVGGGASFSDLTTLGRGAWLARMHACFARDLDGCLQASSRRVAWAVEHYKKNPLVESNGNVVHLLKVSPLSGCRPPTAITALA